MEVRAIIAVNPAGRMNATPICESHAHPNPNMAIIGCVRTPPKTIVFRSIIQQKVVLHKLLPIERTQLAGSEAGFGYVFEPAPAVLLDQLLPRYVEIEVLRALLSSNAAEHAARMTAMGAATKNAGEMIDTDGRRSCVKSSGWPSRAEARAWALDPAREKASSRR